MQVTESSAFFQGVSAEMSPFLREFQSDETLASFLYPALTNLIHCLMTNCEKLCPGQNSIVKDMSKEEILYFREECKHCLIVLTERLKSPSKFKLTRGLTCFDPNVVSTKNGVK